MLPEVAPGQLLPLGNKSLIGVYLFRVNLFAGEHV
jgi:hypothetical protein